MTKATQTQGTRFPLGNVLRTRGVIEATRGGELQVAFALARHRAGDWGDLDADDWRLNDAAVQNGSQILSAYQLETGRIWIITEGDRSVTTILLPEEY